MGMVLAQAIDWFAELLIWFMFIRAILSWFIQGGNTIIRNLYGFTLVVTEPILAPIRQFMSRFNTGMFDFSIIVAFFIIRFIANALIALVQIIF